MEFDTRESTVSYCYETRTVEFYFTKKANFDACLKRHPDPIIATDLDPGYRLIYSFKQCRTPEYLLRVGGKQANTADSRS